MMVAEALTLAHAGWPVIPLSGKIPHTTHGLKDASTSPDVIHDWWRRWPKANVGIALPPTTIVIDIDPRHNGSANLAELTNTHGPLPDTLVCVTGGWDNGTHFYLQRPTGKLSQRNLPEGIDLREGGKHYVVAPPSIHPDSGNRYKWGNSLPVAKCPHWLATLLRAPIEPPRLAMPASSGDGQGLIDWIGTLCEGNRNHGVYWAARTAIDDGLMPGLAEDIIRAAINIGLTEHEARLTVTSAMRGRVA